MKPSETVAVEEVMKVAPIASAQTLTVELHAIVKAAQEAKNVADVRSVLSSLAAIKPVRPDFDGMTREERKAAMSAGKLADVAYRKIQVPTLRALQASGLVSETKHTLAGSVNKSGHVSIRETNVSRITQEFDSFRV